VVEHFLQDEYELQERKTGWTEKSFSKDFDNVKHMSIQRVMEHFYK
jgi:hypothetical protein